MTSEMIFLTSSFSSSCPKMKLFQNTSYQFLVLLADVTEVEEYNAQTRSAVLETDLLNACLNIQMRREKQTMKRLLQSVPL